MTPVDPKWPLTSTKNNRLLVLNVALLHTKYEICPSFPSWDIVFTMFLQCFHNLTTVDPKWPLTSTKNNRVLVLNVVHLHTKYEICPSFPSWDIVFTSRRHNTHTYKHTHTSMNAKVTIIIETKIIDASDFFEEIFWQSWYETLRFWCTLRQLLYSVNSKNTNYGAVAHYDQLSEV